MAAYEIIGGEYGPQRIVFETLEEAEESLSHLQAEFPDAEWKIVDVTTICGKTIKHDNSGVGHNWRTVNTSDIPLDIQEEIAAEIIDGKNEHCDKYVAKNGMSYRW